MVNSQLDTAMWTSGWISQYRCVKETNIHESSTTMLNNSQTTQAEDTNRFGMNRLRELQIEEISDEWTRDKVAASHLTFTFASLSEP